MLIKVKVIARIVDTKAAEWAASIDKALTPVQFKFLKQWTIDGKTSSDTALKLFKDIHARLKKAGLLPPEKSATLYRGVNLSVADFKKFALSGKLPHRGNIESWTTDLDMATRYASGSMRNTPLPVAVVLKYKKGEANVVLRLSEIAVAVAYYVNTHAPYNREVVVAPKDMGFENVHVVMNAERALKFKEGKFMKLLESLNKEGVLNFDLSSVTIRSSFGMTKAGKMTLKK